MAPWSPIQPRAGGGSAAPPSGHAGGRGAAGGAAGGPASPQPEPPGRGAAGGAAAAPLCANLRAGLARRPLPPPRRLPSSRPVRPGSPAAPPAAGAGSARPGPRRPLRSHRPRFCLRGAGAPPSPTPSRPHPSPLSLPDLARPPPASPPAPPLPPACAPSAAARPFPLRLPAPRTLVLGARLPDPPEPPRAARRWSCQDGDPAARVARGLPPRGLRAAAAQEPPQGALAQPGPGGRELLQQRQAAGLQRQRLAPQEGQAGTRKAPRSPRPPAPAARAHPPGGGHPPIHPPGGGPAPARTEAGRPRPPCNPDFPACTFWPWGPGWGRAGEPPLQGPPGLAHLRPPRASAPWGSSAPGLGARG